MKKKLLYVAALVGGLSTSPVFAGCGEVTITEMDWASSAVVTHVAKFLMEQGYNCKVKAIPSSTVPAIASLAETGQPDIVTELWTNSAPVYFELKEQGKVVELGNVLSDGGIEGWWIPKYLAEAHPVLKTLKGVKANPGLVDERFHDCPSGWGCDLINNNNLIAADVEKAGIKRFQHGSGETLATSIAAAYEAKEPWFGYYWAPTSILGTYPMVMVETAPYDETSHNCNIKEDCTAPNLSAYPRADVLTIATSDFVSREAEVAELLRHLSFTNDQMNDILAWQDREGASYEEAAVYFLTTYKDVWVEWLNKDAKKKLASLIK
ncbi:MAG: glycine betaine/proline transport system substrate-binding protein [Paraglaciecola sp.]|jgi:glycine betaine/proline transport system substrate-binding protein